ncbi:MAG: NADPH-dependent oxidoreductase [Betaproteobacteria bacterium]|nr:NADPH-dependent oxidoreductase [Betaproteobacteria bacterium]NBY05148.1 NADPH-dependent oxidoreductase [Betaproteobacteria bacterium]
MLATPKPFIVGIGGTTRAGSTSEMAMRATLQMAETLGAKTAALCATDLLMDPYDPMVKTRSPNAQRLVQLLREADGIVIASPSYHGSIPGLLKNALDYTEDLRSDERPYFDGRAVGCVVCAEGIQAMGTTLFTLRSIVHALRGWPTPYSATINSSTKPFGPDGQLREETVVNQLKTVAQQVVQFAQHNLLAKTMTQPTA